ncbi:MAG: FxsA family protein [Rhodospirillales bacterium]|nr:MAG: FxsA family protein [Rhodospirillales bacterium]
MAIMLIVVFILVPIAELVVLIRIGETIGAWPTVGFVVLTAVVGVSLVRLQGVAILISAQRELEANRFPMAAMFDGACLVLAGACLIVPGFITDAVGFLLLVPVLRRWLRNTMESRLNATGRIKRWPSQDRPSDGAGADRSRRRGSGIIIEGEYAEISPDEDREGGSEHAKSEPDRPPRPPASSQAASDDDPSPWRKDRPERGQ